MAREKRSPLTGKPLRNPGQSLDEQISDLAYDNILAPSLMALFLMVMAGLEWWRYYYPQTPVPLLYTGIAVVAIGYAAFRILRIIPKLRALRLGRDGEKVVGQYLERLREQGYQVFHDVVGVGFNVDHVLIGPAGIFSIETKTFSKRPGPDAKALFDGERIVVDRLTLDRDPIVQAKAQSAWLSQLIGESTGRKFLVRPVALFPGWFVESKKGVRRDVWVLNPKALPDFIENEAVVLSTEDVKLASFHLSRFIRTS